jgi:small-conductance mechanosensitive channel
LDTTALVILVGGAVIIAAVSIALFEAIGRLVATPALRAGAGHHTVHRVRSTMRVMGILVAAWGVLAYTGLLSQLTVLTVSGIAGLIVSLALQSTLSNMISGFFLLGDHIVSPGDWITVGGVKGKVIRVALRNTWIETISGDVAVMSNTVLANGPLINHSLANRDLVGGPAAAVAKTSEGAAPPVAGVEGQPAQPRA